MREQDFRIIEVETDIDGITEWMIERRVYLLNIIPTRKFKIVTTNTFGSEPLRFATKNECRSFLRNHYSVFIPS